MWGMKIITSVDEMQTMAAALRAAGQRIGFVATMGNLHEGHLSLVRLANQHADVVVVSIFVNPTQFGPGEDYTSYPRTFESDCSRCDAFGVDVVLYPSVEEMYPEGASIAVTESTLSLTLCGASRPGHFDGVCTVVAKLFNIVQPHIAVFGEKDAQQLRIIRRMVRDLCYPVTIISGPTQRAADGLALSSRNQHLTPAQRAQATCLRRALDHAQELFAAGERDPGRLQAAMCEIIARAPEAKIDYVALVDADTLQPLTGLIERPVLAALAVWVGSPRLIDNTVLCSVDN